MELTSLKPVSRSANRGILRVSVSVLAEVSAILLDSADLVRQMTESTDLVVTFILNDDVTALSAWSVAHPSLEIDLGGRRENALTLACVANAISCVNSMLLRGLVPNEQTLAAAVSTGNPALVRKIDSAMSSDSVCIQAVQTAMMMETLHIAAFFERRSSLLLNWHTSVASALPSDDLNLALAIANRAFLAAIPDVLAPLQRDFGEEQVITKAVIATVLANRPREQIRRIIPFGDWIAWEGEDGDLQARAFNPPWPGLKFLDLSASGLRTIGRCSFTGSQGLSRIALDSQLATLHDFAFLGCRSLGAIVHLDAVEEIGDGAFAGCRSLKTLKVGVGRKVVKRLAV
jgi:hypothetical protein